MKKLDKFKPLIKFIKEDKKKIIIAAICTAIVSICEIFTGYLNGSAIEAVTKLDLKMALIYMGIYYANNIIVFGLIQSYGDSLLLKAESKLTRKLGYHTYVKALNLPAVAYEEKSSGEIINRITNDADSLSFTIGEILDMGTYLLASFVLIFYIFYNSWIIGLEILVFLIILFFIVKAYNPKLESIHKARKKEQDNFLQIVNESIRGIREIKTLGIKKTLIGDAQNIIKDLFKVSKDEIDVQRKFRIITRFLKNTLEVSVFATCAVLLYYKAISLTFFIAMTYYIYRYMWLIEGTNNFIETLNKVSVSIERVNEILENKLYADVSFGDKELKKVKGIIEFKDVTFNYPNEDDTLNNFNLTIEPHKKVAIVGPLVKVNQHYLTY